MSCLEMSKLVLKQFHSSFVKVKCEIWQGANIIVEPENRGTMLFTQSVLENINRKYKSGTSSITLLDEPHVTLPIFMKFPRFSPYFDTFNSKIDQMVSSGLVYHWWQHWLEIAGSKKSTKNDVTEPQVLVLEHVTIGFKICLIPLLLSIIAFTIEISVKLYKTIARKLIALFIVRGFLKIKTHGGLINH